jgi:hypothetical protein
VTLPIVALGAFSLAGCAPANEENLGGQASQVAPRKAETPDFKSYAEAQAYQTQQAAKNRQAGKAKAPAKSQPKPVQEESKSGQEQPKNQ